MPLSEHPRHPCFQNQLDNLLKKYINSRSDVINILNTLLTKPGQGDKLSGLTGFVEGFDIYKLRIPLKRYNIGSSGGLRLIYGIHETRRILIMICIYTEREHTNQKIKELIRGNLKAVIDSIIL